MRLTIKVSGDLSAFGIAFSQNRIEWIAFAIGAYLSGTLGLLAQYRARKQAADLWDGRLLTRAVL
jgi:hypothetical protein